MARRLTRALLPLLFLAGPAPAAQVPFEGEISVDFLGASLPPLVVTGTGVAVLDGSGGGGHLVEARFSGGLTGTTAVPVTDPEVTMAAQIRALQLDVALGTATLGFAATSSGAPQLTRGALPVPGLARLCFFDTSCGSGIAIALGDASGAAGLGVGGLLTAGGTGALRLSLVGAPWTVGTALLTVTTNAGGSFAVPSAGWVHGPLSFSTSTALPGGAFSAVTPLRIDSNLGAGLVGFGRLRVRFAPEPGPLALWSAGALALAALARRRRGGGAS